MFSNILHKVVTAPVQYVEIFTKFQLFLSYFVFCFIWDFCVLGFIGWLICLGFVCFMSYFVFCFIFGFLCFGVGWLVDLFGFCLFYETVIVS